TLAAEVGGAAIALQLLSGLPYRYLLVLAIVGLAVIIWLTSLEGPERILGDGRLCLLVFAFAAGKPAPGWANAGHWVLPDGAESPLGRIGLLLALVGILFAVGGASIDTVFSGAYNLAQFCGWEWGRYRHPSGAPRFTLTWLVLLVLALAIVMTGVDPVMLTE